MDRSITRKKFEIVNFEPPYEPEEKPLSNFVTVEEFTANCEIADSSSHQLYLTEEAMSHIATHVGWGEKTPHNCIEQGGILLGQAFRDRKYGITYGIVNAAIPALSARGSSGYLEMPHETWREMLDSAERLLEDSPQKELHIIGWYHTHPNGLEVYMSGTDRETQRRLFSHDWQFAMVLNPQKTQWRTFFGGEAEECSGFVITDEETKSKPSLEMPEESEPASTQEAQPARTEDAVTESVTRAMESVPEQPVRRRKVWFNSPSRLLRICAILLFIAVVLQFVLIGLLSATALLRFSIR